MDLNQEYYYEMIKKYTAIVKSIFTNIKYYKEDSNTWETIPIYYGQKEKYLKDMYNKIKNDQNIARKLPVISLTIKSISPIIESRRNPYIKFNKRCNETETTISSFAPVPYIFEFEINILSKKINVGASVIEKILPLFAPDITLTIKELQEFNIINDVILNLKSNTLKIDEELTIEHTSDRLFLSTFTIALRGNLYKYISETGLIETVILTVRNYKDEVNLDENDILIQIVEPNEE